MQRHSPKSIRKSTIKSVTGLIKIIQHIEVQSIPCWLNGSTGSTSYLAVKNGLLANLTSDIDLRPHDPNIFGMQAAGYEYEPSATCPNWHGFLAQLWPDDAAAIRLLQEWFGYCLLDDTSQQKIFSIVGPPRSGKSTIARVLTELLCRRNVASPSIHDLSKAFGLWGLLDKKLAIIPDAMLPRPCPVIEEVLKSISGEDAVDVHRKGLPPLSGVRLKTRLMILANERPKFRDPSGALDRRTLELRTHQSFYGNEDTQLTESLYCELSGILNWSIIGLQRLESRGRFPGQANTVAIGDSLLVPRASTLHTKEQRMTEMGLRANAIDGESARWCTAALEENNLIPVQQIQKIDLRLTATFC